MLKTLRQSKKGQAVVEYAGTLVLATIVVAAAVTVLGTGTSGKTGSIFTTIMGKMNSYLGGSVPTTVLQPITYCDL